MLIAVGTELFQLHASRGVPAVFHRGIPRNAWGTLIEIGAAFRAFQGNDNANALILGHRSSNRWVLVG